MTHSYLNLLGKCIIALLLGFILLPAIVVTVVAFNESTLISFPPKQLSLRWFAQAIQYRDFQNGFYNSMIIMMFTALISIIVGGTFAYVIDRYNFIGKKMLEAILASPLVIPYFTIGIGFLILANQVKLNRTYFIVIVTHVVLVTPFVLRSVYVSLRNLDQRLEMAAAGLGASPLQVIRTITLPLMTPGLFAGVLFSAILSFNEFTASLFVTAQSTQTLPVAMYNYVREYADPSMAALSVIFFTITTVLLVLTNIFLGLGKVLSITEQA